MSGDLIGLLYLKAYIHEILKRKVSEKDPLTKVRPRNQGKECKGSDESDVYINSVYICIASQNLNWFMVAYLILTTFQ